MSDREKRRVAEAGGKDVFLAYSLVGPNIDRAVQFRRQFPDVEFCVTADHELQIDPLAEAMQQAGQEIAVLLDVDSGQHRTGIAVGRRAAELYRRIHNAEGLVAGGIHLYDGQNHQTPLDERTTAVMNCLPGIRSFCPA